MQSLKKGAVFALIRGLFDLLLQGVKIRGAEEFAQGDLEAVAELFDGDGAGVFALAVEDALHGGLRHGGKIADAVGRDAPLFAKLADPIRNDFPGIHSARPPSELSLI